MNIVIGGYTDLDIFIKKTDKGTMDFVAILAPPETDINGKPLLWYPDLVHRSGPENPDVARLQKRGELISLFSPEDQKTILVILSKTQIEISPGVKVPLGISPISHLPPQLSKFILLPGSG